MKNLYRQTDNLARGFSRGSSATRVLVFVTIFVALSMTLDWFLAGGLRTYVRAALQPIVSIAASAAHTVARTETWKTRSALQHEVIRLQEELARRDVLLASENALRQENEILRSLVRLSDKKEGFAVPVISSFSSSPYGTFTIGAGSLRGVQEGDIALVGDFVLGTVSEVSQNSSLVRAVLAPGITTEVLSGTVGFSLSGRGGGNGFAQVPREAELENGAPIVSPSLGERPVGVIGRIESASSSAFSDVYVAFPFNIQAIRFVFVSPR